MNAHIILCNDKKNFAEVDINNLQEINYIDIIKADKIAGVKFINE